MIISIFNHKRNNNIQYSIKNKRNIKEKGSSPHSKKSKNSIDDKSIKALH